MVVSELWTLRRALAAGRTALSSPMVQRSLKDDLVEELDELEPEPPPPAEDTLGMLLQGPR
eukprot:scaffold338389_cov32-Prasinocladus_malaysianus.AAC.1